MRHGAVRVAQRGLENLTSSIKHLALVWPQISQIMKKVEKFNHRECTEITEKNVMSAEKRSHLLEKVKLKTGFQIFLFKQVNTKRVITFFY